MHPRNGDAHCVAVLVFGLSISSACGATPSPPDTQAPDVGILWLQCSPAPCLLSLNERPVRTLGESEERIALPAGEYRLALERDGHLPYFVDLRVDGAREQELRVEMWPRFDALDSVDEGFSDP